jgi:hypothetical protein
MVIVSKIMEFVKGSFRWARSHLNDIILFAIIALVGLFSFAAGYIMAKYHDREPIIINQSN